MSINHLKSIHSTEKKRAEEHDKGKTYEHESFIDFMISVFKDKILLSIFPVKYTQCEVAFLRCLYECRRITPSHSTRNYADAEQIKKISSLSLWGDKFVVEILH